MSLPASTTANTKASDGRTVETTLCADGNVALEAVALDLLVDFFMGAVFADITAAVNVTVGAGVATTTRGLATLGGW